MLRYFIVALPVPSILLSCIVNLCELALGTVDLTGNRIHGDTNKHLTICRYGDDGLSTCIDNPYVEGMVSQICFAKL